MRFIVCNLLMYSESSIDYLFVNQTFEEFSLIIGPGREKTFEDCINPEIKRKY